MQDGRVTSHRFYFDTMELMQQLGLVPEPIRPWGWLEGLARRPAVT